MASVDSLFACELLGIRLSTVIVHCVEPSVIVKTECSQGFLYTGIEKRRNKQAKEKRKEKKSDVNMSEHFLYSVYMP